jgi:hypothetical protein
LATPCTGAARSGRHDPPRHAGGRGLRRARLLGTRFEGADLCGARIDPDGLVQARLTGATVDAAQALAYAAAHGLRIA